MKVIQIGPFPLDPMLIRGGVEASIYGLSVELAKNNEITVFDLPRFSNKVDTIETLNNFQVYRFYSRYNRNIFTLTRIKTFLKLIKEIRPDICHLHTSSFFSLVLFVLLRVNRIKVIVTVHGLLHIEKGNIFRKNKSLINLLKYIQQSLTEFILLDLMSVVIVDTQYVSNEIDKYRRELKIFKKPECKIIPQGINPIYFEVERHNTVKGKLLSVGAISCRKGHLQLIESIKILKERGVDVNLVIIGVKSEINYFNLLVRKIEEYNLQTCVSVQTDLPFSEIINYYAESEIFVVHTQEESQGIVFCEAMAVGLPIVSTNVGGVPWVVENNVNGLLCDFGDYEHFAENILIALNEFGRFTQNNIKKSLNYDWKVIGDDILNVYQLL